MLFSLPAHRLVTMAARKRLAQLQKLQAALAEHHKEQTVPPVEEVEPPKPKRAKKSAQADGGSKAAASAPAAPEPALCSAASHLPAATSAPPAEPAPCTPPTRRMRKKMKREEEEAARSAKREKAEAARSAKAKAPPAPKSEPAKKPAKSKAKSAANPAEQPLDFEISWANHAKLMAHFNLNEDEATATLLSILGPDKGGESFWQKFKANNHAKMESDGDGEEPPPTEPTAPTAPAAPAAPAAAAPATAQPDPPLLTRAERELIEDSQLPPSDDEVCGPDPDEELDDSDHDGEEISSTGSNGRPPDAPAPAVATPSVAATASEGSVMDQLETQGMDAEPVVQPVTSKDDPGAAAREDLARKLNARPTPAKNHKAMGDKMDKVE